MTTSAKLFRRNLVDAVRATEPTPARCIHADVCGGCAFQDRAYVAQVAAKHAALRSIWRDTLPPEAVDRIGLLASPDPFGYRTRMDYVASKGFLGLRRRGRFNYIIDLQECHLITPDDFAIVRGVYDQAMELGLPDYNLRSHEGFLRYIVVRRSPGGQLLIALVTAADEYARQVEQLAAAALGHERVVSFHWLLNDTLTDISFGRSLRHWGDEHLEMLVGARKLRIGPNSFFQNNIHLLDALLDHVAEAVGTASSVADLYGGVGTIALHLADHVQHVTCVESVAESAALARLNVEREGVMNVAVVEADVLAALREQPADRFDVIVADPPRTGLGPEVCAEIVRVRPRRIVYVSCNPLTQLPDIEALAPDYSVRSLHGYDMFPHTPHLEALAVLDRVST